MGNKVQKLAAKAAAEIKAACPDLAQWGVPAQPDANAQTKVEVVDAAKINGGKSRGGTRGVHGAYAMTHKSFSVHQLACATVEALAAGTLKPRGTLAAKDGYGWAMGHCNAWTAWQKALGAVSVTPPVPTARPTAPAKPDAK